MNTSARFALRLINAARANCASMNPDGIPLLKALTGRMAWLSEREQVLAQNVANSDTPGYTPEDLKAPTFRDLLGSRVSPLPLAITESGHLAGTRTSTASYRPEPQRKVQRTLSGNGVDLETEMMKVS